MGQTTYKDAGVDIEKGEKSIRDVKELIQSTYTKNVLGSVGGFGGLFEIPKDEYKKPVLVSSMDGVGTKLRVAVMTGKYNTVGEDLVNHCVNDIAVLGAKPLYFLDYFATARLEEKVFSDVISGFVRGCKNNGCALIGGETAEMPGIYHSDDFDLCGTIVGIVEKELIIDGKNIQKGDVLIGVASSGLHTNGYSLARKVLFSAFKVDQYVDELQATVGESLLNVHKSYLNIIQNAIPLGAHGFSHVTGGGIVGNTKRILPESMTLRVEWNSWQVPAIFKVIQEIGKVPDEDMRRSLNFGIGLVIIASKNQAQTILDSIQKSGDKAVIIGDVVE